MKRTTIYLDPELELQLKREAEHRGKSMAEFIHEAVREKLAARERPRSPYGGAFESGHADTAERVETLLDELGYGRD